MMSQGRTVRTDAAASAIRQKLAAGLSVSAACRAAKMGRSAFYEWKADDPEFSALVDEAIEDGTDKLEDSAVRQALQGNTSLMALLLKSRRRAVYGDKVEHTGSFTNTVELVGVAAEDV